MLLLPFGNSRHWSLAANVTTSSTDGKRQFVVANSAPTSKKGGVGGSEAALLFWLPFLKSFDSTSFNMVKRGEGIAPGIIPSPKKLVVEKKKSSGRGVHSSSTTNNTKSTPKTSKSKTSAPDGTPSTVPLYFKDTYLGIESAKVLCVVDTAADDGKGGKETMVITDQSIFHPQGGGQPSDVGLIKSGDTVFTVHKVYKDPNGVILHVGSFEEKGKGKKNTFGVGDIVKQEINMEMRKYHARLHSAGHLLDVAMNQVGITLKPSKGYHFPKGPYVEYIGKIELKDRAKILSELQLAIDKLIESKIKTAVSYTDGSGGSSTTSTIRRVKVGSDVLGCACGGTHVAHTEEIGAMKITKIKTNKGNTRVSYTIAK